MLPIKLFQHSNIIGAYNSLQMLKHGSKTIQLKGFYSLALQIAGYGYFYFILSYFTDMRTIINMWHSHAVQKNFQEWQLIYRAQSLFKAVMY